MLIPFPSVRTQLILIGLVVLILPWLGISMVRDMESLMRDQQADNTTRTAMIISQGLAAFYPALEAHDEEIKQTRAGSEIMWSDSPRSVSIDGYSDDWPENLIVQHYRSPNNLLEGRPDTGISVKLSVLAHGDRLALLMDVEDDHLYQSDNHVLEASNGDLVVIGLYAGNIYREYYIGSTAPGWLRVVPGRPDSDNPVQLRAHMQVKRGGYVIEISIPGHMAEDGLSFAVYDRDNDDAEHFAAIGNATRGNYGVLIPRLREIEDHFQSYMADGRRITLVNRRGFIIAQAVAAHDPAGESTGDSILERLFRLFMVADQPVGRQIRTYQIREPIIGKALSGKTAHQYSLDENSNEILAVALPVSFNDAVPAVLLVEESTEAISRLRIHSIIKIAGVTVLAMSIVITILLLYAAILVRRIRKLNSALALSVTEDGRLQDCVKRSILDDEIGDLNRGLSDMIGRLKEYQRYLESMASKLSHELRTPLTVVQSSLENLQGLSDDKSRETMIERAGEGLSRLRLILNKLTEATRLENAIRTVEPEMFDLVKVVQGSVAGYRDIYPDCEIRLTTNTDEYDIYGSPELMAQLLDKLVSNAVDFHTGGTPVTVSIQAGNRYCELSVTNQGPLIPEHLMPALFDSMVSERKQRDDVPHPGLGLYIVRLIASFHGGEASAENDGERVILKIRFKKS